LKAVKNIKNKLGQFKLKREKAKQNRNLKAFSLEKASTIGVIYNATNRSEAEIAKKFLHYLKEERKEVMSLGYINSKDASEMVKPNFNYQYFDNSNLSKIKIPKGEKITKFINTPFSILIDLNIDECFPLEYISTLSKARFKVGANQNYRDTEFDLILNINEKRDVNFLIIQVKHYLKMINN